MKSLFAVIALVAACSVANAAEVKKDTRAPVVAAKTMTDQDMDKVTAGTAGAGVLTVQPNAAIPNYPGAGSPSVFFSGQATGGVQSSNISGQATGAAKFGP